MKITDHIAANLTAWMNASENLNTIKKVAARSQIGFGTIRRTKNGEGNPTIINLCDIARAFGRPVEDLLAPIKAEDTNVHHLAAREPIPPAYMPVVQEIAALIEAMDERGAWELLGSARMLARMYPKQKNHTN